MFEGIKKFGFGLMRLPKLADDSIDVELVKKLVDEFLAAGLIKNLGFSFHSTPEELEKILTAHPEIDFVQLQINWADWDALAIKIPRRVA